MELRGKREMARRIGVIAKNFPVETAVAMYKETEIELLEVKRSTPVDLGPLRASEHIEGPFWKRNVVSTRIVAGGPSAEYAIYVHEDLTAFHRVGGPKFIERPLLASRPFMAQRIAKRVLLHKMGT